jgi:hypothetical protein
MATYKCPRKDCNRTFKNDSALSAHRRYCKTKIAAAAKELLAQGANKRKELEKLPEANADPKLPVDHEQDDWPAINNESDTLMGPDLDDRDIAKDSASVSSVSPCHI